MNSLASEKEIEHALEKLAIEEEKLDNAIATEQQEVEDTNSFIRNKSSVSQSSHAKKRRRLAALRVDDERKSISYDLFFVA